MRNGDGAVMRTIANLWLGRAAGAVFPAFAAGAAAISGLPEARSKNMTANARAKDIFLTATAIY
jgi:hypothetical protein